MAQPIANHSGVSVPFSNEDAAQAVVERSILRLWEAVNDLTRLRRTLDDRFRVTIFGSARIERGSLGYNVVRDTAAELTRMGCDIVTGGGPGVMEAANAGVRLADPEGHQQSLGIRVDLPFEQGVNAFVTQAYSHQTFFTRLHHFVMISDAYLVCPGGIGTVLELAMVWQLLQVRHLQNVPLILVGSFWDGLLDWVKKEMTSTSPPLISPGDESIPIVARDSASVIQILRDFHAAWKETNGHN